MNHRVGRTVFAVFVGLLVAALSYQWITNPDGRIERELQEQVVQASREILRAVTASDSLEIVDPLAANRKVGKAYVYREGDGWAVSGYYRRGDGSPWYPYLMALNSELALTSLKVQDNDPQLLERAASDNAIELPGEQ